MSAGRGTPFDALFARLTERMGVMHTATPDTDPTQRNRVEWKNVSAGEPVNRGYRRVDAFFFGFLAVVYSVGIYGSTELDVIGGLAELVGWLDYELGPEQGAPGAGDGFKIGKPGPVTGGKGDAAGFGAIVPVTLYLPVYQQIFGHRTVGAVTLRVHDLEPDGTVPTGDPLNPLQADA